jgi:hypothetical protein
MRTIDDIRHDRLLELIREAGSIQALADRLEKSHSQLSQLKTRAKYPNGTRKAIGTNLAREMEIKLGKPAGWMDSDPATCCTGSPSEYREAPAAPSIEPMPISQSVWRGAANRLRERCKELGVTLDADTFLDVVDAAVQQAGQDASIEAAERAYAYWLPILARGRGAGQHAA